MKNKYKILKNEVIIFLSLKNNKEILEAIIDIDDFNKIKDLDYKWYIDLNKRYNTRSVRGVQKINGKIKYVTLHKLIMYGYKDKNKNGKKISIKHIDGDYLNNRRINLVDDNFNEYSIDDNITTFHITRKNGDKFNILIDTEDLHIFKSLGSKIHVTWDVKSKAYYAVISQYLGTNNVELKHKTLYVHRMVMGEDDENHKIDHINHNTLDNRKENLRITNIINNSRYRKSKNSNNKSGYRNVCWNKDENCWMVQLMVEGKNTKLGSFNDVEEAGEFAEKMRQKYYGEFAGKS